MRHRVGPWHRDEEGTRTLRDVSNARQTGFASDILESHVSVASWRIGESLAECFLVDYHNISIPYNKMRDMSNPNASRAGVDVVGITSDKLFVFGEVKTTHDRRSPPGVIYGKLGLIAQMVGISSSSQVRDDVIRWLGLKLLSPATERDLAAWRAALQKYVDTGRNAFKMYGVLVRDIVPDIRDVKTVHDDVLQNLHRQAFLEVVALYVPTSIPDLFRIMEAPG